MITRIGWLIAYLALVGSPALAEQRGSQEPPAGYPDRMVLVVVLDGLRPDLITPDHMPVLYDMGRRGVWFANHHAIFPSVTRVNAAGLATGCYPAKTGLLGNSIYVPQINRGGTLSTGSASKLLEYENVLAGPVLTCPTLGDLLAERGMRMAVASSGSSGSAFLLDANRRGVTAHYSYMQPKEIRDELLNRCGEPGPDAAPNTQRNAFAVSAYLDDLLPEIKPHLTFLWLSDPDHTQHEYGLGAPEAMRAISQVDAGLGKIRRTLESRGLLDHTNILVVSDHGFSTHAGKHDMADVLIQAGLKKGKDSSDVVVTGSAIHVNEGGDAKVEKIVKLLQGRPEIGALFTPPNDSTKPVLGKYAGTFSQAFVHWAHPRGAPILYSRSWEDRPGPFGHRGITMQRGKAGHGSASPFDMHNTLIATGPDLRSGLRSAVPSANVDVAPTVCRLLGIEPPDVMDGRVLEEAWQTGPHPWAIPYSVHIAPDDKNERYLRYSSVPRPNQEPAVYFDYAGCIAIHNVGQRQ